MTIGVILALIGAILRFGVETETWEGLNVNQVGFWFIVAGVVLFVVSLLFHIADRSDDVAPPRNEFRDDLDDDEVVPVRRRRRPHRR